MKMVTAVPPPPCQQPAEVYKKVFREKETAGEQKRFKTKKSCLERKIRKAYVCMRN